MRAKLDFEPKNKEKAKQRYVYVVHTTKTLKRQPIALISFSLTPPTSSLSNTRNLFFFKFKFIY